MNIFDELDNIIKSVNPINEADEYDDDIDPEYSTSEQGVKAAAKQIADRIFGKNPGGDPGGKGGKTEMSEIDDPLSPKSSDKGGDGVDKSFRSSTMDGFDDTDDLDDGEKGGKEDDDDSPMEDDDFEFDDFDYDDKRPSGDGGDEDDDNDSKSSSGGSGSGGESSEDDYEDGDFDDSELGDEGDYDFGDGDDTGDGGESGGDETDGGDPGSGGGSKSSDGGDDGESKEPGGSGSDPGGESGGKSSTASGRGSKSKSSGSEGGSEGESGEDGDTDYDDTLDYDSKDYDSLESEIEDALERAKEGSSSKHEKESIDKMKEAMGDEDGKSSSEKADELSKEIEKALDDSKTGSGELAGESLDDTPTNDALDKDMSKAGFDKKDIEKMKKAKDTDTSGEIDDEKIAKEAMEEMDKKAKERGEKTGSSLSRTIMRNVLKGKVTNMEWKEMVGVFLKSKSKSTGGTFAKSKSTGWGDKKHLWRDAIMPKSISSGGDLEEINCFIDFSGSVSQPLVFSFLQRVLHLCGKLSFGKVNVYGFGEELSEPFVIKKKDLIKGDERKQEEYLNKMWEFIDGQNLGGSIENFEVVAKEILKLKRKDHDCPIMIFGDGLWGVSYPNPKPPIYLKELCSRYLKDILALVYYEKDYYDSWIGPEIAYLREIVGLKHVVTTEIRELE